MTAVFAAGGYRYIPAVFQYSGGVAAEPGFAIVRMRFQRPVPLAQGFARIERVLGEAGRPLTSFCACELRSPAPFTEEGFRAFNEVYAGTLRQWGVMQGDTNPIARSNVCPEIDPPAEPSFHAFCFTVAAQGLSTFVVAGSGEAWKDTRITGTTRCGAAKRRRTRSPRRRASCSARWSAALRARCLMGRHDRHAGLHGPRPAPLPGWRDRAARGGARRVDLALRPAAGARPRIRDGLPRNRG